MKTCDSCGETKPIDDYSPNRTSRLPTCKPCNADRARATRRAKGIGARVRFPETFWQLVRPAPAFECWEFQGATAGEGYGYAWDATEGRPIVAHRVAYRLMVGEIPAGLQLDHLCRNRRCVNPYHLEPVTPRVNVHRAMEAKR